MKRGHKPKEQASKRDHLETAQAEMVGLLRDLDEVILRNKQAMRRTAIVVDVLTPAVERLVEIRESLRVVHTEINEVWSSGQERNWYGRE